MDGRLDQWLVIAVYAQRFKAARDVYESIEEDVDAEQMQAMGIDLDYDVSRMYAYLQFPEELEVAPALTSGFATTVDRLKKIKALYGPLRERNKDPRAELYLKVWDEGTQMNLDYHAGKWVDLKFDTGLHQWRPENPQSGQDPRARMGARAVRIFRRRKGLSTGKRRSGFHHVDAARWHRGILLGGR